MDKLVVATTENVSNHIYDDVALVILSKLPIKSLFRFLCVNKSWSLMFQNPYFMDIFRRNFLYKNHSYDNDTSLLLHHIAIEHWHLPCEYEPKLYSLSSEKSMLKLDWPNPFQEQCDFDINGYSVNGIFCIERAAWVDGIRNKIEELGRFVLWNPATDECKVTSPSPFAFEFPWLDPFIDFHGFGYDQVCDDYKVVRHIRFHPITDEDFVETWKDGYGFHESLWEIYSLNYNCWRKLDLDMPTQYFGQAYTDGVCHWCCEGEIDDENILVSFDLKNETFVKTFIPSNMDYIDSVFIFRNLIMLNGSIGLISNYAETSTFHVSILGEVGIKESWIKLFIVDLLPCVEHPIGIGNKGDIFFRKNDGELVWFNLYTQKIEELGVKGESNCQIMIYKESFLPFERINN
ncbi:F-box/kelch-repeat protein [Trifolium repens]|nr:F-box/kelch-repeat protein [Trifolium repens]